MRETVVVLLLSSLACTAAPAGPSDSGTTRSVGSSGVVESTTSTTSGESSGAEVSAGTTGMAAPDVPGEDADTSTGGETVPTASDYCESIVDSFCAFYLRCGRMDVESADACRDPFLESCNAVFEPQYVGLEDAGLLSLSADGLAGCEAHLAEVACEAQVFELTGPCGGIWEGTQAAGKGCGLDVEYYVCDSSASCTIGLDFCGTCETVLAPGEDCSVRGTTCGAEGFCDEGICRARVPNGGSCTPDDRCMAGSACVEEICEGPTFVARGDACDATRRCPYLTACIGGVCSPTARLGEACDANTPCEAGTCEAGICTAPRDDGDACESSGGCSSGLCAQGSCAPRPSACISRR
ncbi:MAG: hypothetical protein ACE37F_29515 [Nannocystaceae bacterium]|nr:hypothetical protein [bacterium]